MNGHTAPSERIHHDTVDTLALTLRRFKEVVGCVPGLVKVRVVMSGGVGAEFVIERCKADVDAAFRRILLAVDHRWACGIVFCHEGQA